MPRPKRLLYTLDVGKRLGYCIGLVPREQAFAGSVTLGGEKATPLFCAGRLGAWLRDRFERQGIPHELAVEERLYGQRNNGSQAIFMTGALHGAIFSVCACYNVPVVEVNNQTWRKAVTGKGRWGDRELGKRKAFEAALHAGLLPPGAIDRDAADACGVWLYRSGLLLRGAEPGEK